ncbi:Alpha/beta hydrolase [Halomicronema hongdechloris C2206]|uniref:Alpha/beta hydrolase n=1 Tax=Halomicronema hongdechloris C2206 TaxID=1641165 RepID=A0A1Z3HSA1_9CYAN|nr:alpha/beta hydrolase [Halomicronema hongdechloris]ASC73146.1 Alpha/beta hydrolase [Halomicronema hongdechloris C2206]
MFVPPDFDVRSVVTPLGTMAAVVPGPEVVQAADDRPLLVFLHGFGGGSSQYEWSLVYPAFTAAYRVIAADLLGWGASDHPARNYTLEDYLQSIRAFLAQVADGRPVTVVASSLTAAMIARLAKTHPEQFQALILVAPAGLSDFGEDYGNSLIAQLVRIPVLDRVLYASAIATEVGISNFLEQRQFANPSRVTPEMVKAYLKSATQPNAEYAALAFVRGNLCFDVAKDVATLTVPTVLLWGEQAQLTPVELGRRLAALNPEAIQALEVISAVGLTPQLEQPGVTIGLLYKWLPRLHAAGSKDTHTTTA